MRARNHPLPSATQTPRRSWRDRLADAVEAWIESDPHRPLTQTEKDQLIRSHPPCATWIRAGGRIEIEYEPNLRRPWFALASDGPELNECASGRTIAEAVEMLAGKISC